MKCTESKLASALLCLSAAALLANPATPAANGKDIFAKRCSGCHSLDKNGEGPRLRGVLGRKAGTVANFLYSDELRKSGFAWDEARLMQWLENTQRLVPSNDMEFRVADAEERAAIVEFLKSPAAR